MKTLRNLLFAACAAFIVASSAQAAKWHVTLAGNGFSIDSAPVSGPWDVAAGIASAMPWFVQFTVENAVEPTLPGMFGLPISAVTLEWGAPSGFDDGAFTAMTSAAESFSWEVQTYSYDSWAGWKLAGTIDSSTYLMTWSDPSLTHAPYEFSGSVASVTTGERGTGVPDSGSTLALFSGILGLLSLGLIRSKHARRR